MSVITYTSIVIKIKEIIEFLTFAKIFAIISKPKTKAIT